MKKISYSFIAFIFVNPLVYSAFWPTDSGPEDGWKQLEWFGDFYSSSYEAEWFYHAEHAWLFPSGDSSDDFFAYMPDRLDWTWTALSHYPWQYSFAKDEWLYYGRDTVSPRWFYNHQSQRWETGPTEALTVADYAKMEFPAVDASAELPPHVFPVDDDETVESLPFTAKLGYLTTNGLFSETANTFPGEAITAIFQLELKEGVFVEDDKIGVLARVKNSVGGFDRFWITRSDGQVKMVPVRRIFEIAEYLPLEIGSSGVHWDLFESGFFVAGEYVFEIVVSRGGRLYVSDGETVYINEMTASPDPENIIADTGFRPIPDGYGFQNFDTIRDSDLTDAQVVELLGEENALFSQDNDRIILRPMARLWKEQALEVVRGGHCLGMAISSSFIQQNVPFEDKISPADFQPGADETIEIQRAYARNVITFFAVIQQSGNFLQIAEATGEGGPTKVLNDLIGLIRAREPVPALGMYTRSGEGGHAITPYLVTDEGNGIMRIYVYDNNFPADADRFIEVDTNADTWFYGETQATPGSAFAEYEGDAATKSLSYIAASLFDEFERDIGRVNEVTLTASSPAEMFIEVDDSQIGYDFETAEYVDNYTGGEYLPYLDVNSSPAYLISTSTELPDNLEEITENFVNVTIGVPLEDDGDPIPDEVTSPIDFFVRGTESGINLEGFDMTKGDKVSVGFHSSGRAASLLADDSPFVPDSLELFIEDDNEGYIFRLTQLELDPENGFLAYINDDLEIVSFLFENEDTEPVSSPKGTFDLEIIRVNESGEQQLAVHSVSVDIESATCASCDFETGEIHVQKIER